jgi:hypothetical protein
MQSVSKGLSRSSSRAVASRVVQNGFFQVRGPKRVSILGNAARWRADLSGVGVTDDFGAIRRPIVRR